MFEVGWPELAVVALVALIVIGPRDLPKLLHTLGLWMRKARAVTRDFHASLDEMSRELELAELRKLAARHGTTLYEEKTFLPPEAEAEESAPRQDEGDRRHDGVSPSAQPSPRREEGGVG